MVIMSFLIKCPVKLLVKSMAQFCSMEKGRTIYKIRLSDLKNQNVKCLLTIQEEQWIWNKRVGHVSLRKISQLNKLGLVRGFPNPKYTSDALCEDC